MKYLVIICWLAGCMAVRPTDRIEFEKVDIYPEGIAYDSARDVFYVSSMRDGSIGKVSTSGQYTVLHADSSWKSGYGMKLHPDGRQLWVMIGDPNYSRYKSPETYKKMIRLVSLDVENGNVLHDIDLSSLIPGEHFGNDLCFDDQQNVYITDSYANAIYKVTAQGQASVFAKDSVFNTEGYGLNGIVFHPDEYLLVASTNKGAIFKVDIRQPTNITKVKTDQFYVGADGLLLNDPKNLTVVTNGGNDKIFQLQSDDNWISAKMVATTMLADRFTYPATATFRRNEIWVMNAKTSELVDSNAVPAKIFAIQKAVLKPVK